MELTDIQRSLQLFSTDNGLVEIRALGCWDWKPDVQSTQSGYFDAQHLAEAEQAAIHLEASLHASGVYITLNPASPDLLARSANRVKKAQRDGTTKDGEIVSRRWILIDIDPTRPAGVSSTDAELATAQDQAGECQAWLHDNGWPSPVVAMSGNGWHLLYRVDLPADDKTIENCLKALATKFPLVDTSTFNAARITKLYGTIARKGDSTHDRPHRRSKLVEVPDDIKIVHTDCLEWLAGQVPKKLGTNGSQCGGDSVDLSRYLQNRGVPIIREGDWNGARRFFIQCPGIETHSSKNADSDCSIWQDASGMLAGKCFHDSCGFKSWDDFTGYFGQVKAEDFPQSVPVLAGEIPSIDPMGDKPISFAQPKESEPKTTEATSRITFGINDESLWNPGGLIQEIMNHNLRTAYKPQPELAMLGGLSLVSAITGQKVQAGKTGIRPNAMFAGLAGSGAGKEHARQINKILLSRAGGARMLSDSLASDVGLLKQMSKSPCSLIQLDELGRMLETCDNANKNPHLFKLKTMIMQLFSSSGTVFLGANHADDKNDIVVYNPNCVIYGTTTPSNFFSALTIDSLKNGFFNRWIILEATNNDPDPNDDAESIEDIPEPLIEEIKWWLAANNPCPDGLPGPARRLTYCDSVRAEYKKLETVARKKIAVETDRGTNIWTRCHEYAQKLGLLHQLSLNRESVAVSVESARWGCALALRCTERMEEMAEANISDGLFDAIGKKLRNFIKGDNNGRTRSQISRHVRNLPPRELTEALSKLIETGEIAFEKRQSTKGPSTEVYVSLA